MINKKLIIITVGIIILIHLLVLMHVDASVVDFENYLEGP